MANVRGLYEDQSGQRWAWNGYDYVKVGRDFDPRSSAFGAGVSGAVQDVGAGLQQIIAGIRGDDAALAELEQGVSQRRREEAILARTNPLAFLGGQILPYAGAAGAGGAAGGFARGALGAWGGATAADVGLGAAAYGTPGERAANALIAGGASALGLGGAMGARAMMRGAGARGPGTATQRVEAALEGGPGAGGRVMDDLNAEQTSLAARIAGRMLSVGRLDVDQARLRDTARARRLADQYGVRLTPAMRSGSQGMEQVEASLMSNPWSAAPGQRVVNEYKAKLEQATKDFVLPGYEGPLDEDFLAALSDDINRKYQEIASVSEAIDTEGIRRRAQDLSAMDQGTVWTTREHKVFNDLLNNVMAQGDTIQGGQAWNLQQQYAEAAARRFKAGKYEEGTAFQAVADAIETSLIDAASGKIDPADLNVLRKRYRVKLALERAGGARGREGLPLASTYNSLQRQFPVELGEGRGFAQPELNNLNKMFDMWSIGNKLFRPIVGDSGTATRLSTADMSPRGIGANALRGLAASMYYNEPTMALRPALGTGAALGAAGVTGGAILD